MIDVTKIWDRLFLGSLLDAERLGRGNPLGISAVILLSETAPCNTRREITYIHVPIDDAQPIPVNQFDAIMRAIADHIRSPFNVDAHVDPPAQAAWLLTQSVRKSKSWGADAG